MITFTEFARTFLADRGIEGVTRSRSLCDFFDKYFEAVLPRDRCDIDFSGVGMTCFASAILAYAAHCEKRFLIYVTRSVEAADHVGMLVEHVVEDRERLIWRRQARDRSSEPLTKLDTFGVYQRRKGLVRMVKDFSNATLVDGRWEGVGRRAIRPDLVVIDDPYTEHDLHSRTTVYGIEALIDEWAQLGPTINLRR